MNGSLNKGSLVKGTSGSGGGGGSSTAKFELFDIKTISEPTAQKGWSCISYPTQNKLDKADVPTAYDMLAQKLAGVDSSIGGWQSLGNNYIGFIVDDNVIISHDKIYYAKIVDIGDNTKWNLLVDNESFGDGSNKCWVINDIVYIFTSGKNVLMINKNTFEIIKTLPLNVNQYGIERVSFTDGYIYVYYYDNVYANSIVKIKYSLVADEITEEIIQNTSIRLVFRHSNGYYYFVYYDYPLYYIYKATDLTDSSTYTFLNRLDSLGINAFYSDYSGKLIGVSNSGTVKITTNIDNWTSDVSTQTWEETVLDFTNYGSAYTTSSYIEYFYRSQNGFVFVFSCTDKKIALYSEDLTNFSLIVELDSNFAGNQIDCNGSFAIYNITGYSTLYYSSPTPTFTEYTDTINGIDIKYYKNGNYKICTPDIAVGNDDNLQDVYEYLGYLNYWWIDTTEEKITLQRNSNMWTFMYVGDDYSKEVDETLALPTGISTRLLPQKQYIEDSSATITFDDENLIQPNTDYVFGSLTALTFDEDSYVQNQLETTIQFTAGSGFSFADSSDIVWVDGTPTFTEGSNYLILIFNNLAFIREW